MKITSSNLIGFAGLCAVPAGIIFAAIQPIHPPDVVESVTTSAWAIITSVKTAMCLLFLVGITGLYARQMEKAGWLGLAGFLVLIVCWTLQTAFVFAEAFIMPPLAATAPAFVDGYLGISYGHTGGVNFGALPTRAQRAPECPRPAVEEEDEPVVAGLVVARLGREADPQHDEGERQRGRRAAQRDVGANRLDRY